jgi:TolA-binding protein
MTAGSQLLRLLKIPLQIVGAICGLPVAPSWRRIGMVAGGLRVKPLGAPMRTVVVAGSLLLGACATQQDLYYIDQSKINTVVKDVLNSQQEAARNPSKLEALHEYEDYILKHFAYKDELKAEALHRLGDLYMKMEDTIYNRRLSLYTAEQDKAVRPGQKDRSTSSRPKIDHSRSIAVYEQLLKLYPNRAANDSALYQLAKGYYESGQIDRAIAVMERLLKQYPNSFYRSEASFRLGEFYFESGLFTQAAAAYEAAMSKQDNPHLVEIIRYKLGWTYFELEDYPRASELFLNILDSRAILDRSGKKRLDVNAYNEQDAAMLKEVIRAALLSIDYQGGPVELEAYFKRHGHSDYEELLYHDLGDLYLRQDRIQDAGIAYATFVEENPLNDAAPLFQSAIVHLYTQARWTDAALQARMAFDQKFGPASLWWKQQNVTARNRITPKLKEAIMQVAQYYHAQAQAMKKPNDYQDAIRWYKRFLDQFPDAIEAGQVTYLLGELYYDQGRYAESAAAYEKSAYFYPTHETSSDAGYGAIVAAGKAVEKANGRVPDEVAIAMYETAAHFADTFPKDKHVPDVLLKGAEMAYQVKRYEASRQLAKRAINSAPSTDGRLRYLAQKLISSCYFEEKNFSKAADEYRKTVDLSQRLQPQDAAELKRVLASAIYKQMEALKKEGQTREAAEGFIKLYDELPTTDVASIALFDAGAAFLSMGNVSEGLSTLQRLLKDSPNSPYAYQAMLQIGSILQKEGRYDEALQQYNQIARSSKDPKVIRDALWAMATLAEERQEWNKAYEGFSSLAERPDFADPARRFDAQFRAAMAKDHLGEHQEAAVLFEQLLVQIKTHPAPGSDLLAGKAWLQLAGYRFEQFDAVRLVEPLKVNLTKKEQLLQSVIAAYVQAATYNISDITTAATYQTGRVFEAYRTALLQSERPKSLTPDQLEEYNFLLEEQAAPYEERSIATYEANVHRAQQQGVYTPWVQRSYDRLAELLPARYRRQEQSEVMTLAPLPPQAAVAPKPAIQPASTLIPTTTPSASPPASPPSAPPATPLTTPLPTPLPTQ